MTPAEKESLRIETEARTRDLVRYYYWLSRGKNSAHVAMANDPDHVLIQSRNVAAILMEVLAAGGED